MSLCKAVPFLSFFGPVSAFSESSTNNKPGRRVVTGLNAEGRSIITGDGAVPKNATYFEPGQINMNTLWVDNQVPVDLFKKSEAFEGYNFKLEPPPGGFNAFSITLEPGFKPDFHRTNTIDFIFIISGKVELLLEGSSTILTAGDSVFKEEPNMPGG